MVFSAIFYRKKMYKDVTGYGFFTAAMYGTRWLADEYGTTPKVECRIHAPASSL